MYHMTHYVGPVLLAKQHPEEETTFFHACSNTTCDLYRKHNRVKGKHCHSCGSSVKQYKGKPKIVRKPTAFEVQDLLESNGLNKEALWQNEFLKLDNGREDFVIYMPNNYLGQTPPAKFHAEDCQACSLFLSDRDPQKEIQWFKKTYKLYILDMKKLYDQIQVHWAILNYQS